jgi:RNA-directed DNA polymerase
MPFRLLVAQALAQAFLIGPWNPAALRRLALDVVGTDAPWITQVVRAVRRHFSEPPEDEEGIARLASVIESQRSFRAAFWGREVPRIRRWLVLPPAMGATPWPVPPAATLAELGRLLEVEPLELDWLADPRRYLRRSKSSRLEHYHRSWLPKQSGGFRLIEVPKARIKLVQRRVLRRILDLVPAHACAEGFVRGRSALSHARRHTGHAAVLCLDLEDFFTSIPQARVFNVFRAAGYPGSVARVLAGLCTTALPPAELARCPRPRDDAELARYRRLRQNALSQHLPQGAPTSPALANLCALGLDRRLAAAAASTGAEYSRYADDLAFSGDAAFARKSATFATLAAAIALDEGFDVNFRKTRIMRRAKRQQVCGLVLNERPNIARRDYDRLKAVLTNCQRHGAGSQNRSAYADYRAHLQGRVAWVESVAPARGAKLRALFDAIDWSKQRA